jgi:hypothetical protein
MRLNSSLEKLITLDSKVRIITMKMNKINILVLLITLLLLSSLIIFISCRAGVDIGRREKIYDFNREKYWRLVHA